MNVLKRTPELNTHDLLCNSLFLLFTSCWNLFFLNQDSESWKVQQLLPTLVCLSLQVSPSSWTQRQPTRSCACPTTAWPWRRTRAPWRRATLLSASAARAPMELLVTSSLTVAATTGRCCWEHPRGEKHCRTWLHYISLQGGLVNWNIFLLGV